MNGLYSGGTLDKLQRPCDLRKDTRQSDNLSNAAARALQTISQVVLEYPGDASLREMRESFRAALGRFSDGRDKDPARAAA
jgi:hypothetical protein